MLPEELEKVKRAPAAPGVLDVILDRWSPRAFTGKAVSSSDLECLFEAARWAASSSNEQPWRFLIGRHGSETYKKIFNCLVEGNRIWVKNAPVLMLSACKRNFSANGHANRFALHDTGAATATLALQATALGMHAHHMAGYDAELARASFAIPQDYEPGAVTAIGYLGDSSELPEPLRAREEAPRERMPVKDFVFSKWDVAAEL